MARSGREMGYTSHEVKRIYRNLIHGNDKYEKNAKKCTMSGCRGGFRHNNLTGKIEECPKCKGYGFLRKS